MQHSGKLIIIVGPDGVGKTTIARKLVELYPGPTGYFHWIPDIGGDLPQAPPLTPGPPPPKAEGTGSAVAGWLRLARNVVRMWVAHIRMVRPALANGALVVGDRGIFGYHGQPIPLRFYGPAWLASAAMRCVPKPDIVANLSAPAEEIVRRKQELTSAQAEAELKKWRALPLSTLRTFDCMQTPEQIAQDILNELERKNGR